MDFFGLLQEWLRTVTVVQGDFVLKTVGILSPLVAITQLLKKGTESLASQPWLVKTNPGASELLEALTRGHGPKVINLLLSSGTVAYAAAQDGRITGWETSSIVAAVLGAVGITIGNDALYRIVRNWLFPKGATTEVKMKVISPIGEAQAEVTSAQRNMPQAMNSLRTYPQPVSRT